MNKFNLVLLMLLVYLAIFTDGMSQEKNYNLTIEQVFTLPEEKIDLGLALLIFARDVYPNLDIRKFDQGIDFMADWLEKLMQRQTEPLARISMMNTFLYKPGWWNASKIFTYDLDDLEAAKTDNQFLNGYLATNKGSCVTMPMLHLVLADRLGWPIQAVKSPHHIFCRYITNDLQENNIEATCGGGYIPDERYISDSNIPGNAILNGVYMRTLTKREYLASMLLNNARYYLEKQNNLKKAAYITELALSIDSTLSPAHWNLGKYYYLFARDLEAEMINKIQNIQDLQNALGIAGKSDIYDPNPVTLSKTCPLLNSFKELTGNIKETIEPFYFEEPGNIHDSRLKPELLEKNPALQLFDTELRVEISHLQEQYMPLIEEALIRAKYHEEKARELGIVQKLPDEFFTRQSKSIEKYKSTGEY